MSLPEAARTLPYCRRPFAEVHEAVLQASILEWRHTSLELMLPSGEREWSEMPELRTTAAGGGGGHRQDLLMSMFRQGTWISVQHLVWHSGP